MERKLKFGEFNYIKNNFQVIINLIQELKDLNDFMVSNVGENQLESQQVNIIFIYINILKNFKKN